VITSINHKKKAFPKKKLSFFGSKYLKRALSEITKFKPAIIPNICLVDGGIPGKELLIAAEHPAKLQTPTSSCKY